MRQISVPVTINGEDRQQLEFIYNIDEVPFLDLMLRSKTSTKSQVQNKVAHKIHYHELICAFDIETTNMFARDDNGRISKLFRPYAFMYQWQVCLDKYVIFGRRWEEWQRLMNLISNNMHLDDTNRLVMWVHNLPFEFNFCRRFMTVTDGFYKEPYKPLRVMTSWGIEFRCSQALTNMSLAAFCKNSKSCIHRKAEGDLEYNQIRTAATPLSELEEGYCYNDVRGLCEALSDRLQGETMASVPMTSTGFVRRDGRNAMRGGNIPDKKEAKRVAKLNRRMFENTALSADLYRMHREGFRGGNTHANAFYANRIINEESYGADITSEYPTVMMIDYMPMSAFNEYPPEKQQQSDPCMNKYCYIFRVLINNPVFHAPHGIPYIPISKCTHYIQGADWQEDNGRIRRAEYVEMTVTEIDWKIICRQYKMDVYKIKDMYAAQRGQLPKEYKEIIMKYYRLKTTLKGKHNPDDEYMYQKYKNMLNALYGMMTTRIDQSTVLYHPGEPEEFTFEEKPLEEILEKFYKSRNSFLPYQWGVWVTAHARKRLETMLWKVGSDVIYCDTDSIKFVNAEHIKQFEAENKKLIAQAEDAGAYADNDQGKRYYLGTWDMEYYPGHVMTRFVTLGAKKYLYESWEYNKKSGQWEKVITSTIAGVKKSRGAEFFQNNGMAAFRIGMSIPESGHLVGYRNDDMPHYITVDGCTMLTASNQALVDDTYTIGVTDSYLQLLAAVLDNITYQEEV